MDSLVENWTIVVKMVRLFAKESIGLVSRTITSGTTHPF